MKSGPENVRRPLTVARILATNLWASVVGVANALFGRREPNRVRLEVGDPAPDFELQGSDGRVYRLSEFKKREAIVLAWFPKAFTSGCTAECRTLQSSLRNLQVLGVRCFAVSSDAPETNRAFAAALGLEFPILSDPDRRAARAYGVLGPFGFPSRWTFMIGTDGRIAAIDRAVRVHSHGSDLEGRLQRGSFQ